MSRDIEQFKQTIAPNLTITEGQQTDALYGQKDKLTDLALGKAPSLDTLDDATLAQIAIDTAAKTSPKDKGEHLQRTKALFKQYKAQRDIQKKQNLREIPREVAAGSARTPESMELTEEQKRLITQRKPYTLNNDQVLQVLLEDKQATPKEQQELLNRQIPIRMVDRAKSLKNSFLYKAPRPTDQPRPNQKPLEKVGLGIADALNVGTRFVEGFSGQSLASMREGGLSAEERAPQNATLSPSIRARGLGYAEPTRNNAERYQADNEQKQVRTDASLLKKLASGFKALAKNSEAPNYTDELWKIHHELKNKARQEVLAEKASGKVLLEDISSINQAINENFQEKIKSLGLVSGINDPDMLGFLHSAILDPLNFIGPLGVGKRVVGAGRQALGKAYAKAGPLRKSVVDAFVYRPDLLAMETRGAHAAELASLSRAAADVPSGIKPRLVGISNKASNITKDMSDQEAVELMRRFEAGASPKNATEVEKFKQLESLAKEDWLIRQDTGRGSRFNPETGILEKVIPRRQYVPHVTYRDRFDEIEVLPGIGIDSGAMPRTGKGAQHIQHPGQAWQQQIRNESRQATVTGELKALQEGHRLKNAIQYKKTLPAAEKQKEAFNAAWKGEMDFDIISGDTARELGRLSGNLGKHISEFDYLVLPKETKIHIEKMIEHLPRNKWGEVFVKNIQPVQNFWRTSKTLLRDAAFYSTNWMFAVGAGTVANGIRSLNPKLQFGAARTAIHAMLNKTPEALKLTLTDRTGNLFTGGDALKLLSKYGYLGQHRDRYVVNILKPGVEKLSFAERALNKQQAVVKTLRLDKFAGLAEDYQKLIVFLGDIENIKDPIAIAKSLDYTAKMASNYARRTPFETKIMNNVFGFYNWKRFVLPYIATQVIENPQRMAAFQKGLDALALKTNRETPNLSPGDDWLPPTAITAPKSLQPKPGQATSDVTAKFLAETPITSISSLFGDDPITDNLGPTLGAFLSVMDKGLASVWGGTYGGSPIDLVPEKLGDGIAWWEAMKEIHKTPVGKETIGAVPFGNILLNMIKLSLEQKNYGNAVELSQHYLQLKYIVGRGTLGLFPGSVGSIMGRSYLDYPKKREIKEKP
jgi:hypothetical protein